MKWARSGQDSGRVGSCNPQTLPRGPYQTPPQGPDSKALAPDWPRPNYLTFTSKRTRCHPQP
ncbi:hypothetical protein BDR05DRAFT_958095 [Suillus weaverae]|nr:hypothetical protein BDR05DRAFT_958095 [Suillus weaverae]